MRSMRTGILVASLTEEERQVVGEFGVFLRSLLVGRPDAERSDILTTAIRLLQGDIPPELEDAIAQDEEEEEKRWN
jgi:hypothetical protein